LAVALEFAQVVAKLVETVGFFGKVEAAENDLMNVLGAPWELDSTPNWRTTLNPKKIKSGPAKQWMEGKEFRLAKEIKYIQHRAAEHDGRIVTIGPLVFFSTETGDAWMLEPADQLAARLAPSAVLRRPNPPH
jgi:hypothetical protein